MRTSTFDRLTSSLDYPMVVVTAASREEMSGCLVGFFTQCSLDPPRFCVYLSRANHTHRVACRSSHLLVHFLHHGQHALAAHFGELSGDEVDKFDGIRWRPGPDGRTPCLVDVDAWLFGRIERRCDGGDHEGFVMEPLRIRCPRRFRQLGYRDVQDLDAPH